MAQMKTDLQHVYVSLVYYIKMGQWKSGISQIPCGMAEKRRKCGIIPPKAKWLACLQ